MGLENDETTGDTLIWYNDALIRPITWYNDFPGLGNTVWFQDIYSTSVTWTID